jgi:hypothetical protein
MHAGEAYLPQTGLGLGSQILVKLKTCMRWVLPKTAPCPRQHAFTHACDRTQEHGEGSQGVIFEVGHLVHSSGDRGMDTTTTTLCLLTHVSDHGDEPCQTDASDAGGTTAVDSGGGPVASKVFYRRAPEQESVYRTRAERGGRHSVLDVLGSSRLWGADLNRRWGWR